MLGKSSSFTAQAVSDSTRHLSALRSSLQFERTTLDGICRPSTPCMCLQMRLVYVFSSFGTCTISSMRHVIDDMRFYSRNAEAPICVSNQLFPIKPATYHHAVQIQEPKNESCQPCKLQQVAWSVERRLLPFLLCAHLTVSLYIPTALQSTG